MRIPFAQLEQEFKRVLLKLDFPEDKAALCAYTFAANNRDGVYSHGLNRFPVFIDFVKEGLVDPKAEPEVIARNGATETWNGHRAPGIYNATLAMKRAVELAKAHGIGCVALQNTSHWMRGGTYGWQAADAGCIGICFTNALASMPAWGGTNPVLGNNPLVIAVPRAQGHVVLDMAMSQFSYGKMQEYQLENKKLPFPGGYDEQGNLTNDPAVIRNNKRALPIGFWKGSGLALLMDVLLMSLAGGRSTVKITADGKEFGVSQCFIALHQPDMHGSLVEEILQSVKDSTPVEEGKPVSYPGENTLKTRLRSENEGVLVNEEMWNKVLAM
jgi:3-dehydro-L-gulonate 2-dehydrogenase